jgi:hypothetical protein
MISPSSRKRGGIGNFETPLRGSPSDLQDVPERVPSIDPLLAAGYWLEALDYVDFAALAATGKKEVKPLAVFEFKTIGDKAGMTSADI